MRRFVELFARLDATTSTNAKVDALADHFAAVDPADGAWAVYFLSGEKLGRLVPTRALREWALEETGLPEWLFEECYVAAGDLAETLALVLDAAGILDAAEVLGAEPAASEPSLAGWVEERLRPLVDVDLPVRRERLVGWWRTIDRETAFLVHKLLTGGLRVGVSKSLVERALARVAGVPKAVVAHRLMGAWAPSAEGFEALVDPDPESGEDASRPYPFYLASPVPAAPPSAEAVEALGPRGDWQAEWKWDGIRAQLVVRGGEVYLWSRGEELVTEGFPRLAEAARALPPGTVLDGEILAWRDGEPLPFSVLQRRTGRKRITDRLLEEAPVLFMAYDLLEAGGEDWRPRELAERRDGLEAVLADHVAGALPFAPSPVLSAAEHPGWEDLARLQAGARERRVEGLMLKRRSSPYRTGRKRGDWWKWKVDPFTVDAVLIYAQAGHGRRANLFTDYTFAVWRGDDLVPIAKAYSGLEDAEIRRLDRWIRRHTRDRFGPVRSVDPEQVFEVHFEGLAVSSRHKSGLALRFPRIGRWREDLGPQDADRLEDLEELLERVTP